MKNIKYPKMKKEYNNRFFSCLKVDCKTITNINAILNNIIFDKKPLSFKIMVESKFEDLVKIKEIIEKSPRKDALKKCYKKDKNKSLYKTNQPNIASFFMIQNDIDISTCYYCNIDYINAFEECSLYNNELDFFLRSDSKELQQVKGIGEIKAKNIISYRNSNPTLSDIAEFKSVTKCNVKNYKLIDYSKKNHFTIDHILPQSIYPYFNLSLYNFIPSCYSCNSKFKKAKEFEVNSELPKIIATSDKFDLNDSFTFKVFFDKTIEKVMTKNDYDLQLDFTKDKQVESFLKIFKLKGRYQFHKNEVLELIKKKIEYPDSRLLLISNKFSIPISSLKRDIFGSELFDEENDKPLIKLKKDIAKQIGIL